MIKGYDISNVNGNIVIPDDATFVIAKVSQDATFTDQLYLQFRTQARHRGIGFGGYHYADIKEQPSANESCDRFIDLLGDQEQGEIAALDAENDGGFGGLNPGDPRNRPWILAWGERFISKKNYKPKLYISGAGLTDFDLVTPEIPALYDLWYAWWPFDKTGDNPPPAPEPFTSVGYKLWQYNADDIDKDMWLTDIAEFKDTGYKLPDTPVPPVDTPPGPDYEALYWTPINNLITQMQANPTHAHADAAFHAIVFNAIVAHKIAYGVESAD